MDFQYFVKFMDYIELKLVSEMQNKGWGWVFCNITVCIFNNASLVLETFHRELPLFH